MARSKTNTHNNTEQHKTHRTPRCKTHTFVNIDLRLSFHSYNASHLRCTYRNRWTKIKCMYLKGYAIQANMNQTMHSFTFF